MKHSLKYYFTGSSGVPNISEGTVVMMVDGIQACFCDSSNMILEPRKDWAKKILENDPQQKEIYTQICFQHHPNMFRIWISILKQHFNQSAGAVFSVILYLRS